MSAAELLLVSGIMMLAHELKPSARLLLGASCGAWGLIIGVVQYFI